MTAVVTTDRHGRTLKRHRPEEITIWAQLIKVQLKPGSDLSALATCSGRPKQPGSGLVRELFMHDQNDLDSA